MQVTKWLIRHPHPHHITRSSSCPSLIQHHLFPTRPESPLSFSSISSVSIEKPSFKIPPQSYFRPSSPVSSKITSVSADYVQYDFDLSPESYCISPNHPSFQASDFTHQSFITSSGSSAWQYCPMRDM
jgi:hypothetical protein